MQTDWEPIPAGLNDLSKVVVDAAFTVHSQLGPGLLESVYEACLAHELRKRGHSVLTQVLIPVTYDSIELDAGLKLDLLIDGQLIVEVKSVLQFHPVYEAQLLTYLKFAGIRLGLLINFNVTNIGDGIKRKVR